MTRRNRVDPWGDLRADPARGRFTGNRGCLVDDDGALVRHHRGTLWIACVTRFRDRRVGLARPGRWTPLFFLDDAVALAAGHRPCGECRPGAYLAYREAVAAAVGAPRRAGDLNRALAAERLDRGRLHRGRGIDRAAHRRTWLGTELPTAPSSSPTGRGWCGAGGCSPSPSTAGTTRSPVPAAR